MSDSPSTFAERLQAFWHGRRDPWLALWTLPLSWLFAALAGLRRAAFACGLLRRERLPVPVVVVGNIHVGGAGKTPLTLALLAELRAAGLHPGVISRGYGGAARQAQAVHARDDPAQVGDEPLLYAQAGFAVAIGRRRSEAGRALLAAHPEVNVILADDGLQHYALARDIELAVVDGGRGFGTGRLLPAGPLREPVSRLARVDAVVVNGDAAPPDLPAHPRCFHMRLQPGALYQLSQPARRCAPADLPGRVVALAGIGHPQRFFDTLRQQGLTPARCLAFADHHAFTAADLPVDADAVVITSKDAVKWQALDNGKLWVLPVTAQLDAGLVSWLVSTLKELRHGQQAA